MKRIALTQRVFKNETYSEIREALDINWGKFCQRAGFVPVVLPVEYDFKLLSFDGVILTGGNDLSSISGDEVDQKRDHFEKLLLEECILKKIPIFGVCRGMQIINEYFGGTLKKISGHVGTRHLLKNRQEVNSYHEYAVDKLGEGLQVINITLDGDVESIRHKSLKIYAQMHHSEREIPFNAKDIKLIKDFFKL